MSYPKVYLYRRIVQAKLYIDSHFAEPIALDAISDEAYFSKFHFIRTFRKIYGMTPHQYLTAVRIRQTKLLLKNGSSVSEACFSVGFDSLSSFTGLFKRQTGITPSAYRKQQLNLQQSTQNAPLNYIPGCFSGSKREK
jgi:AraC-like DNA-binding protein